MELSLLKGVVANPPSRGEAPFANVRIDQDVTLKALQEENRRLKKAVADLVLDKQIIEEVMRGKD
jgi:putative transposase